jgi:hypothetical protein
VSAWPASSCLRRYYFEGAGNWLCTKLSKSASGRLWRTGSVRTVRRYVAPFRQAATAPDPAPAVPKNRHITRGLLSRPDHLEPGEQARLAAVRASCPHIDALAGHVARFAEISSGKVEGTVNKMLKRQMYGRATFGLLRTRVILHPA